MQLLNIVLASFLLICFGCARPQPPKPLTDRDTDGLLGNVKSVQVELAKISTNPHVIEGARTLFTITSYAQEGWRIQNGVYWLDEAGSNPTFTVSTADGKQLRLTTLYKEGTLDSKLVERVDAQGRKGEEWFFDNDGAVRSHVVYSYNEDGTAKAIGYGSAGSKSWVDSHDALGNKVESSFYDFDKVLLLKNTYKYDEMAKLVEVAAYWGEEQESIGKWSYAYDEHVNRLEATLYGNDGSVLASWHYQYALDLEGNWVKRTAERLSKAQGGETWVPLEAVYRTIEYWSN